MTWDGEAFTGKDAILNKLNTFSNSLCHEIIKMETKVYVKDIIVYVTGKLKVSDMAVLVKKV